MTTYSNKNYFAITISPPPYGGNSYFKYIGDQKYFQKILQKCSKHYLFIPEFDNVDRLHYHGIIRVDNKYTWYRASKRKFNNVGFVNIKLIKNFKEHLRWLLYIKKDWGLNRPHFIED